MAERVPPSTLTFYAPNLHIGMGERTRFFFAPTTARYAGVCPPVSAPLCGSERYATNSRGSALIGGGVADPKGPHGPKGGPEGSPEPSPAGGPRPQPALSVCAHAPEPLNLREPHPTPETIAECYSHEIFRIVPVLQPIARGSFIPPFQCDCSNRCASLTSNPKCFGHSYLRFPLCILGAQILVRSLPVILSLHFRDLNLSLVGGGRLYPPPPREQRSPRAQRKPSVRWTQRFA